jgi:hypothetical protein
LLLNVAAGKYAGCPIVSKKCIRACKNIISKILFQSATKTERTWCPYVERAGPKVTDGEEVGAGVEGEGGGRGAVGGGHAGERLSRVRLPRHHAAILAPRQQH